MKKYDYLKDAAREYLVKKNWQPNEQFVAMMAEFAYLNGYKKKATLEQINNLVDSNKKMKFEYDFVVQQFHKVQSLLERANKQKEEAEDIIEKLREILA